MSEVARSEVIVSAENQFTEYIYLKTGETGTVTVDGAGTATLTLQVLLNNELTPVDIDTVPSNGRYFFQGGDDQWRVGCKTGDYTSGTRTARIQG